MRIMINTSKCDSCKNKSICKWCETMKEYESKVKDIKTDAKFNVSFGSPIEININCIRYETNTNNFTGNINILPYSDGGTMLL